MAQEVWAPSSAERFDLDANDESLAVLVDLQRRLGDVHRVPARSRAHDGLVVHDADAIRRVLQTHRGNYVKGVGLERVRVLLGNGLIVNEGESWARQRRLMQPAFHSQVIRGFAGLMHRVNVELIARWERFARSGESVDVTRELSQAALDVVLRALFSRDLDLLVASEGSNPFHLLTENSRRDLAFAARFRGLARFVRGFIDARRLQGRVENDLLSMLMQARDKDDGEPMPERLLLDEAMTLIVAGHETTASTLNWAWYLISQHPEVEERLAETACAQPDDETLAQTPLEIPPYIEQVLNEGLRLYPPVWLFSRRAVGADRLGGFDVAAGTDIFLCPYLLHRHPAYWEEPERFVPERFEPAPTAARNRFAFLPFSAGPRFCIGSGFAMAEMALHLTMLARRFRLVYAAGEPPVPEFQINLRTREGVPMRLEAR
jgi:cytochrome P450